LYDVLSIIALELTDSAGQPMRADTHLGQWAGRQLDLAWLLAIQSDEVDDEDTEPIGTEANQFRP
jgi:hypothetical protein